MSFPTTTTTVSNKQKLPFLLAIGATTAVALFTFGYKFVTATRQKKKKNLHQNISTTTPTTTTTDDEDANSIRRMQPQFEQAAELARRTLQVGSTMTVKDQLMLYGLYKQAKFGDCNVDAPSKLRIKENHKHKAWTKFTGISQSFAIANYIEAVKHFSTLASEAASTIAVESDLSLSPEKTPRATTPLSPPTNNYSPFLEDDDDSDIVYDDDNGEEDTVDFETKQNTKNGNGDKDDDDDDDDYGAIGMGAQSTLLHTTINDHHSIDLSGISFDNNDDNNNNNNNNITRRWVDNLNASFQHLSVSVTMSGRC